MGNEQSNSSVGSGVSSSISFLAGKRGASVKKSNQIVVVRPGQDPIGDPADDPEIKRLQEIRRFLPILKSALPGMRDSPEVFSKVGSKPILKFCYRIQEHLTICAKTVSNEQATVQTEIKHADHISSVAVAKYQEAAHHTDKLSQIIKRVKSTNQKLTEVENLLRQLVPKAEELGRLVNEVFPPEQQLPPLDMAKIMYRSPPPSNESSPECSPMHAPSTSQNVERQMANATISSNSLSPSTSTRLNNHIMPIDEHRVVDRFLMK
ncbi:hypothetical protein L596_030864 [Steinernema carpocapsae]|uniref:BLOC-1-related complex subunit 5 n=1 Tax=Steinernema carpocapsae TaxID=34508 RepID=A0A4U5LND7_STECR|nr:hypothetical protein L596_030864 [Steinernema carpocapsae]